MKKLAILVMFLIITNLSNAQNRWFTLYSDSVSLVRDANEITGLFIEDITRIKPDLTFEIKTVLNTTPYFIYYDNSVANVSLWRQLPDQFKDIVYEVSGGKDNGEKVFGLFFNGFYLPHELGHGLQDTFEGEVAGSYKNEHFANTVAILWWRKQGKEKELKQCYDFAKKMLPTLPNPVPEGKTIEEFYTENYRMATQNVKMYGFMQWTQFLEIYEDKTLPDFDTYMNNYLKSK